MKVRNLQLAQRFLYTDGSCVRSRPVMQTVVRKLFPSCDAMTNMASFPVCKVIYCMVKRACTCTANHLFATGDFFWHSVQDLQELRCTIIIIRLITPLLLTSNEVARETRPWKRIRKRHLPWNLTSSFEVIVNDELFRMKFAVFQSYLIFYYIQENIATNSNIIIGYWILLEKLFVFWFNLQLVWQSLRHVDSTYGVNPIEMYLYFRICKQLTK